MMADRRRGAIEMSTVLKDPMIPEMARKAIDDQTKEEKMLEEWTSKHGCRIVP